MIVPFLLSLFLTLGYEATAGLEQKLAEHIHVKPAGENNIGYIEIDDKSGSINNATWYYIHQAAETFKTTKPDFVILKINTPGGETLAALKICDALKELDTQFNIPVIAYIDNWAISAGALVAYACRFIAVVQDGAMGAAEPVLASETGEMTTASEKINSAFRITFANQASYFGRDPNIAEAMVDKDILLVKRGDQFLKLNSNEEILPTDKVISPKGKLLTLTAKEMMEYGVADLYLNAAQLPQITPEEKELGHFPFSKTALFLYPFFANIGDAKVYPYKMDFRSQFFSFLMSPVIASLLMLGVMLGLYLEFTTPGVTLPGAVAIICLFLLGLSSFALQIGSWLEITLLLGGVAILLIDLFAFPTFGLLGSFGVLLIVAGLLGLVVPELDRVTFDPISWELGGSDVIKRVLWFFGTLLFGILSLAALAFWFPGKYNPLHKFVLQGEQEGYTAGGADFNELLGKRGKVLSPLRPSGRIEIDGVPYDVQSTGDFIPSDETVIIERVEGARLFVRKEE